MLWDVLVRPILVEYMGELVGGMLRGRDGPEPTDDDGRGGGLQGCGRGEGFEGLRVEVVVASCFPIFDYIA
jgi:hypothetical protein